MAEQPRELARTGPSQDAAALAGYERGALDLQTQNVGAIASVAREQSEIQAAIILAQRFPRDEAAAYERVMASCKRPTFAAKETCVWDFKRGGKKLSGPGVALAREMARHWGHIQYAIRIVSQDEETVHIAGFAYDCQTNTRVTMEDSFKKLIYRKKGGWVVPDERDLRELINRRGAICVRNAILQVLPPDLTEDAVEKIRETRHKAASGDIEQDWDQARRRLTAAFREYGVTTSMLEKHLGHSLEEMTPDELVELRGIYGSLADGHTKPGDHFEDTKTETSRTDAEIEDEMRKPPEIAAEPSAGTIPPESPASPTPPTPEPPVDEQRSIGTKSDLYRQVQAAYGNLPPGIEPRATVRAEMGVKLVTDVAKMTPAKALEALAVIENWLAKPESSGSRGPGLGDTRRGPQGDDDGRSG